MPTISYSGEQTVDVQGAQTLISQLSTIHQEDSDITVRSASLRFQDGEKMRVITSIEAVGDVADLDSLQDSLSRKAADLDFEDQDNVEEEIEIP